MVRLSEVEVILVTYHSRDLVAGLLAAMPDGLPVAIVDNARGADSIHELISSRSAGRYVDGGDVGFAKAANLGARTSSRPYLVFVNPDATPRLDQLLTLVDDLVGSPDLAAVGATTTSADGRVEIGVGGWEPTVARVFVYATTLHRLFPNSGVYARPEPYRDVEVEWLTGACLAVPRETFLGLGGFDEKYFIYNEDMAYGRRIRNAGLRQRLRTDVLVPHAGAGSGGSKSVMLQMRGASMCNYLKTNNGRVAANSMRILLAAGALGRATVLRCQGKSEEARGFTAYNRGLWRGAPDMG